MTIRAINIYGGAENTPYIEPISSSNSFSIAVDNPPIRGEIVTINPPVIVFAD